MRTSDREKLLRKIAAIQFSVWELHVYLDTHIDDPEAVKLCKKYTAELKCLVDEYEQAYGPLKSDGNCASSAWLKDPWPWDISEGDC